MLKKRFKDFFKKSLASLKFIKYIIKDIKVKKNPVNFVLNIVLYTKNININNTKYVRILLAYKYIDNVLKRDFLRLIK